MKIKEKIDAWANKTESKIAGYVAVKGYDLLKNTSGEGYVDTGIKIVISVVIGGLLLTWLYALFQLTIFPNLETKIQELFSYGG